MELHRFYAQLHDCVQSALWRVDRVYVGLHVRRRARLCPLLFGYRPGGKPGYPQFVLGLVAQ